MPRRTVIPGLYFNLRADDLQPHQVVVAVCFLCAHRADVPIETLRTTKGGRQRSQWPRIRDLAKKLRCTACKMTDVCHFEFEEEISEDETNALPER